MNNWHTNQLKKHILGVSTCKIHRLKTNSTSVTALTMVRCPYQGGVFMKKGRLCVCVDTHISSCTFGQVLAHCVYM